MTQKERVNHIIQYFRETQPVAETELHYSDPFQLLVAVMLSAQCTDKRVNLITPSLFEAYPDAGSMATATPEDIFPYIKSCSYPNNKAKHISGMARALVEHFDGKVPDSVEKLQQLPGVGRKTANVVAVVIYQQPVMPVDTHVFRVSARLGMTRNAKSPLDAEKQLVKLIPEDLLPLAHHWLILHGRYICQARKPKCASCGLRPWCAFYLKTANTKQKS